jgi:hypothetical protein
MPRGKRKEQLKAEAKRIAKRKGEPRTPRGELSPFGARYIGRKNKPAEIEQGSALGCDYYLDAKVIVIRRNRKKAPYDAYFVPLIVPKSGKKDEVLRKCSKPATARIGNKRRCAEHLGADYEETSE